MSFLDALFKAFKSATVDPVVNMPRMPIAIGDANEHAFVDILVPTCEGTNYPNGYRYLFGSTPNKEILFDDLSKHPRVRTYEKYDGQFIKNGKLDFTTPAGKWQITASTWDDFCRARGARPFDEQGQRDCAMWKIELAGALPDIRAGRWEEALQKCADIWASLPANVHAQPGRKTIQFCMDVLKRAGATFVLALMLVLPMQHQPQAAEPIGTKELIEIKLRLDMVEREYTRIKNELSVLKAHMGCA